MAKRSPIFCKIGVAKPLFWRNYTCALASLETKRTSF